MLRFCLIVTFSCVTFLSALGQDFSSGGTLLDGSKSYVLPAGLVAGGELWSGEFAAGANPSDPSYNVVSKTRWTYGGGSLNIRLYSVPSGLTLFRTVYNQSSSTAFANWTPDSNYTPPTPTPTPTPTPPPMLSDSIEYDYSFGSEYEGMRVVIRDQDGNYIEEYIIGENGLDISGSLVVEGLTQPTAGVTAILYRPGEEPESWVPLGSVDIGDSAETGSSVGSWIQGGPLAEVGSTYTEGGYTYRSLGNGNWSVSPAPVSGGSGGGFLRTGSSSKEIPGQYGGGQWSLRNQDGGLVATGAVPSGGGEIGWSGYVGPTESDGLVWSVQPIVTNQEGTPSFGSPVILGPGDTTPDLGTGVVVPNPGTNTVVSPNPSPATNNLTPIDIEPADLADIDDNETAVIQNAQGLGELLSRTATNLSGAGENLVEASQKFNALRLNPVSSNCTFVFGPANVTLQSSSSVRAGLSLLILGIGAFGAARMIREAVQ